MNLEDTLWRIAINENTRAIEELTEKISNIKANDSTSISLEEYESMKHRIETLEAENWRLKGYFDLIKLPYNLPIIPGSIEVISNLDLDRDVTNCRIYFDVNMAEYR